MGVDILVVCTGNTCRSAMAEVLLRRRLEVVGAPYTVGSAGTLGWGGGATRYAIEVMREHGLDLTSHRSRRLTPDLVRRAGLVIGMTRDHLGAAVARDPGAASRAFLPAELVRLGSAVGPLRPGESLASWAARVGAARPPGPPARAMDQIADPLHEDVDTYRRTVERLDAALTPLAALLAGRA